MFVCLLFRFSLLFCFLVSFGPPDDRFLGVNNHRTYKIWEALTHSPKRSTLMLAVGRFICREWNKRHRDELRLTGHRIYVITVPTNMESPAARTSSPPDLVWDHIC